MPIFRPDAPPARGRCQFFARMHRGRGADANFLPGCTVRGASGAGIVARMRRSLGGGRRFPAKTRRARPAGAALSRARAPPAVHLGIFLDINIASACIWAIFWHLPCRTCPAGRRPPGPPGVATHAWAQIAVLAPDVRHARRFLDAGADDSAPAPAGLWKLQYLLEAPKSNDQAFCRCEPPENSNLPAPPFEARGRPRPGVGFLGPAWASSARRGRLPDLTRASPRPGTCVSPACSRARPLAPPRPPGRSPRSCGPTPPGARPRCPRAHGRRSAPR